MIVDQLSHFIELWILEYPQVTFIWATVFSCLLSQRVLYLLL
jgi:hypothetical protein